MKDYSYQQITISIGHHSTTNSNAQAHLMNPNIPYSTKANTNTPFTHHHLPIPTSLIIL
jgi:hypothetical protein